MDTYVEKAICMFLHRKYRLYLYIAIFAQNFNQKNGQTRYILIHHSCLLFILEFYDFIGVCTFWSPDDFLESAFNLHESSIIFTHIIIPTSYNHRYRHIYHLVFHLSSLLSSGLSCTGTFPALFWSPTLFLYMWKKKVN